MYHFSCNSIEKCVFIKRVHSQNGELTWQATALDALFSVTTWGESHGAALGAVIDGCPPAIPLSPADIQKDMDRRRPGRALTSPRTEPDTVEILSGVFDGLTTGTPISLIIYNRDVRSSDYSEISQLYRPGHADRTYEQKYGLRDWRGGGRSSARETRSQVAEARSPGSISMGCGICVYGFHPCPCRGAMPRLRP